MPTVNCLYGTPGIVGGVAEELKFRKCQDGGSGLHTRRILVQPPILITEKKNKMLNLTAMCLTIAWRLEPLIMWQEFQVWVDCLCYLLIFKEKLFVQKIIIIIIINHQQKSPNRTTWTDQLLGTLIMLLIHLVGGLPMQIRLLFGIWKNLRHFLYIKLYVVYMQWTLYFPNVEVCQY